MYFVYTTNFYEFRIFFSNYYVYRRKNNGMHNRMRYDGKIRLIYCIHIPVHMTTSMEEFIIVIALGIIYIGALIAYNKFGKKKDSE